ncbi:hypothetical protein BD324DRAFT_649444 [Kockovaella imperatae]|uniref:Uncharacterized protein n=1 Tax=Kockovaella imperatae TaxID=4999 RepID=A0A1Y1UMT5_9TREE|nr:hypothetical protein BD324DRAFT_649444 [Kockovaella imperatae]ORX39368.1 hypothetical protein BD324DRAFT_649444 [Kockovaella imperatae]
MYSSPPPSSPFAFSPPGSSTRKRAAETEPLEPHNDKKRRPNLANGFSGLSISPRLNRSVSPIPSYEESEATKHEVDEDDGRNLKPVGFDYEDDKRDVRVEELPERSTSEWTRDSTTSSSTSSREADDSDTTFRPIQRTKRRYARVAQQADSVEQPDDAVDPTGQDLHVVDMDPSQDMGSARRKRRRKHRDGVMDMDSDDEPPPSRSRRKTKWHEPEKDRIIITSLGSSDSEVSPESTPSPETRRRYLSQPGAQGFTLSPSLLTHLLNSSQSLPRPPAEKGLVLYRSMPIPSDQIVNEWHGHPNIGHENDSLRFEEIDDDEIAETGDVTMEGSNGGGGGNAGIGSGSTVTEAADEAMEIE